MSSQTADYETRQTDRAYRDAMQKYDGDAFKAMESYVSDVRKMLASESTQWESLGLVRLYTRIAVRLACDYASC
jgi:gamma-glutamylcysteine synthetase